MEAVVKILDPRKRGYSRQSGFSMVELLLTAFILAVGVLGLTMLQVMSMRASSGGRALNTAVMVGEATLESIQSEGRQKSLFMKFGGTAPATTYFGAAIAPQYYAFDGTVLPTQDSAFFTVTITPADVVAAGNAGRTRHFTVVVTFADTPNPANPTLTVTRTVTLSRQVAYAA